MDKFVYEKTEAMSIKVTYLLGAGASANALPVVNGLTKRFKFFCMHYGKYLEDNGGDPPNDLTKRNNLIRNIENHYTVDTYAKKLYLQNRHLHTNEEYQYLINYLSAYFIYEQLEKSGDNVNAPLRGGKISANAMGGVWPWVEGLTLDEEETIKKQIENTIDYRYDSFFASVLTHNQKNEVVVPKEINIISWNYDSQFEKAYMNFTGKSYDGALDGLNSIGLKDGESYKIKESSFIKLNGTAAFYAPDRRFGDLFNYGKQKLDKSAFSLFKDLLSSQRSRFDSSLRFAWENNKSAKFAINTAQKVLGESDIIIVVGYSFPYFNREVDREIFKNVTLRNKNAPKTNSKDHKVYIQAPQNTIDSICKRFESIKPNGVVELFTETDQFLIPNEM